jgi:PIN domain nuclease of toxin-antitoxin system
MVIERYLLDTSTILWTIASSDRLSAAARHVIAHGLVVASVVSYWEAMVKSNKGRLSISDPVLWWQRATQALGAEVLPIRSEHVSALGGLPDHHRDPFDRMLIAQAISDDLVLVTSDKTIRRYPVRSHW